MLFVIADAQHPSDRPPGKKNPEMFRKAADLLPDLCLETADPSQPAHTDLAPGHPLYALAAWAYHHADDLDQGVRNGFFDALHRAWPSPGRPKQTGRDAWIMMLWASGIPAGVLAERWALTEGHVDDIIRDARARELSADMSSRVRPNETDGVAVEPLDPATAAGNAAMMVAAARQADDDDWRRGDELARELGFGSAVQLILTRAAHLAKIVELGETVGETPAPDAQ